jgi:hypothetical protein
MRAIECRYSSNSQSPIHCLICVKNGIRGFGIVASKSKEAPVPVDSFVVAVAVLSVFAIFAGVLMWADVHSGPAHDQPVGGNSKRRSF